MANGWAPTTGEELISWLTQQLRIQQRHRHPQYLGEVEGAIDASSGVDTLPLDTYVEGVTDDYPLPQPPTPGTPPPSEEDVSPIDPDPDILGFLTSVRPVGVARIDSVGTSWPSASGSGIDISGLTYDPPVDSFAATGGASLVSLDDWITITGNEIVLADGWYDLEMWLTLGWDTAGSAPPSFGPFISGPGGASLVSAWTMFGRVQYSTTKYGVQAVKPSGLIWMGDGSNSLFPGCFMPVSGSGSTQGSVSWGITKWA